MADSADVDALRPGFGEIPKFQMDYGTNLLKS